MVTSRNCALLLATSLAASTCGTQDPPPPPRRSGATSGPVVTAPASGGAEQSPSPPAPLTPAAPPEPCRDLGASPTDPPTPLLDPQQSQPQGFDVSAAQGEVPWRALTAGGLAFAYARASEGLHIVDGRFAANWAAARACVLPRGAYHVFEPTEDATAQADAFLKLLGNDFGELPPVLDVEISRETVEARKPPGKFPASDDYEAAIVTWLKRVEQRTGKRAMIYMQDWYWHAYFGSKSVDLTAYLLWAAGDPPPARDDWPYTFWQHGSPAKWADRQWDRDLFNGTSAELAALIRSPGPATP